MTTMGYFFNKKYFIGNGETKGAYYIFYNSSGDLGIKDFASYYLLFNGFIPFTLVISLETLKLLYTIMIHFDVKLKNAENGKEC